MNTITKHDAIYIAEDQYSDELKKEMKAKWLEIVTKEIFNYGSIIRSVQSKQEKD